MSECNHCRFESLKARAEAKGLVVTTRPGDQVSTPPGHLVANRFAPEKR